MARDGNALVDLTQNWDSGREVTGDESMMSSGDGTPTYTDPQSAGSGDTPASSGNTDPPKPEWGGIKVSLATMEDAETTILSATKGQIADFEGFRDRILANQDWVFWNESEHASGSSALMQAKGVSLPAKDPHPEQTQELINAELGLMQACGAVIQLVGTFVGQLNDSAQMYAHSDKMSFPPDFG